MPKKSYSDLLEEYDDERDIPYGELLQTGEWFSRREEIIDRDDNKCSKCGAGSTNFGTGVGHHEFFDRTYTDQIVGPDGNVIEYEIEHEVVNYYDEQRYLQVHHKHYVYGRPPWKYPDKSLITLCNKCHKELHEEKDVKVYESEKKCREKDLTACRRCGGKGIIPPYSHVKDGICFRCEGARFEEL